MQQVIGTSSCPWTQTLCTGCWAAGLLTACLAPLLLLRQAAHHSISMPAQSTLHAVMWEEHESMVRVHTNQVGWLEKGRDPGLPGSAFA